MPKILDLPQGSNEWLQYRAGRATGSNIHLITAKTRSGPSASRQNYLSQLVVERLTGKPTPTFQNEAMRIGSEREPQARLAYELSRGVSVNQIGLLQHPTLEWSCSSPDGLIGENYEGSIEIKCPTHSTHLETLLASHDKKESIIQSKYLTQIYWLFACSPETQYCDFISYNSDFPAGMELYVQRIERTKEVNKAVAELQSEVTAFLEEVQQTVEKLKASYALQEAA